MTDTDLLKEVLENSHKILSAQARLDERVKNLQKASDRLEKAVFGDGNIGIHAGQADHEKRLAKLENGLPCNQNRDLIQDIGGRLVLIEKRHSVEVEELKELNEEMTRDRLNVRASRREAKWAAIILILSTIVSLAINTLPKAINMFLK